MTKSIFSPKNWISIFGLVFLSCSPVFSSEEKTAPYEKTEGMDQYRAQVVEIMDGDTIRATIDLGFGVSLSSTPVRMLGVWAPEKFGASKSNGLKAKRIAEDNVKPGEIITVLIDHKRPREKYGRVLGVIILSDGSNLNQRLQTVYVKLFGPPVVTAGPQ